MRAPGLSAACAVAAAVLALSGCSDPQQRQDTEKEKAGPPDRTSSAAADVTGGAVLGTTQERRPKAFAGVQHPLPRAAALRNVPALYERVALTGCAATSEGWQASGTARNEDTAPQALRVLVFFTDVESRVVDSASTTVSVPAGSTRTWTAEREFETTPGTKCVVRAVSRGR